MWVIWEYVDHRGERAFSTWRERRLSPAERGVLDEKMRALERFGTAVSFLKPVSKCPHLRKLRLMTATQALRPLLCLGPFEMGAEFTMLMGAREQNFEWDPVDARATANQRREEIKADKTRRVRYEVPQP